MIILCLAYSTIPCSTHMQVFIPIHLRYIYCGIDERDLSTLNMKIYCFYHMENYTHMEKGKSCNVIGKTFGMPQYNFSLNLREFVSFNIIKISFNGSQFKLLRVFLLFFF